MDRIPLFVGIALILPDGVIYEYANCHMAGKEVTV